MTTLKDLKLDPTPLKYFTRDVKPADREFTGMGIPAGTDISKLPVGFQTKDKLETFHEGIAAGDAAGAKRYVEFYEDRFPPTKIANFFLEDGYVASLVDTKTKEIPKGTKLGQ